MAGGYATAMEPDTTKRILDTIRAIPRGQVAGYGEVARRAGLPGRARLVARLLGQNEDRRLPWHRVLRSDGRIAFPEGSPGWREQSARLRSEGVVVEKDRRLEQLKRFKDDVKEVRAGQECGMKIDGYDDIKEGDILECYRTREVRRKL